MNILSSEENGVTILAFTGRLDTNTVAAVDQAFATAVAAGGRNFVWDFAQLNYISSAGLRTVLQALKQVSAKGGKLVVCSLSRNVHEVFDISGFKSLLTICPDRAKALAAAA
jgi:anti-anti-sigma factor